MKRTKEEMKAYNEWKIKKNKEAYRISQLEAEERKKYYENLPELTKEEKQLEEKFKTMSEEIEGSVSMVMKWFLLVASIITGILFFNGSIPFLFFLFPVVGWIYYAF